MQGERKNNGKLRWRNIPLFLFRPIVEVGQFGESKYSTFNFLKGLSVNTYLDSAMRHMDCFLDPTQSDYDEESGLHHLAHASWNLIAALHSVTARPDLDDRYKGQDNE